MPPRLALASLLLLVTGCGDLGGPQAPETFRVVGAIVVVDPAGIAVGPEPLRGYPCLGDAEFADIASGSTVVIRDSGGTQVASGKLGRGRMMVDLAEVRTGGGAAGETQGCQLGFAIAGIPAIGRKWSVQIGTRTFAFTRGEADNLRLTAG